MNTNEFYESGSSENSPHPHRNMLSRKDRLQLDKYENYIQGSIGYIESHFSENGFEEKILKPTAPANRREIKRNIENSKAKKMIDACEISNKVISKWREEIQFLSTDLTKTVQWKAREKAQREHKTRLEIQHREKLEKQQQMDHWRFMSKLENGLENELGEILTEDQNRGAENVESQRREFTFQRPMQLVPLIDMKRGKLELTDDVRETFTRLQSKVEFEKPCKRILKLTEAFVDEMNSLN